MRPARPAGGAEVLRPLPPGASSQDITSGWMRIAVGIEMREVRRGAGERQGHRGTKREAEHAKPRRIDMRLEAWVSGHLIKRLADLERALQQA